MVASDKVLCLTWWFAWSVLGAPAETNHSCSFLQSSVSRISASRSATAMGTHTSKCEKLVNSSCVHGWRPLCPKALLLGTNHGGSTTIANYFNKHPKLSLGMVKEEHYLFKGTVTNFIDKALGGYDVRRRSLSLGRLIPVPPPTPEAYIHNFNVPCSVEKTIDASPQSMFIGNYYLLNYSMPNVPWGPESYFPAKAGEESVKYVRDFFGPDVKLIMTIRDPVDWVFSLVQQFPELYDPDAGFHPLAETFMCWADSLEAWLQTFPAGNFLFVCAEDLFANETFVAQQAFNFLDLPPMNDLSPVKFTGRRRSTVQITSAMRQRYHSTQKAKDCRSRLEQLTGKKCNWTNAR
eukprot:TRINITY_DN22422_c0_g1_i1.p1 TRINITY_DN22422_c0_g1~~TRINITY_DN22422_c0_g1_i1.p1  ORF type:complete len:349 (+),score=35.64 TRINITY_DN22422_c0_g1_i1:68-1114(+)